VHESLGAQPAARRIQPLEQTAARVAELRAGEWQDVDVQESRIRSRGVKGKRGTRRVLWRQVPVWFME